MPTTAQPFTYPTQTTDPSFFWESNPGSPTLFSQKGHLFGLIQLKEIPPHHSGAVFLKDLSQSITQFFHQQDVPLSPALQSTIRHFQLDPQLSVSFLALAVFHQDLWHLSVLGNCQVILLRGQELSTLLAGQTEEPQSLVGPAKPNDKLLLASNAYLETYATPLDSALFANQLTPQDQHPAVLITPPTARHPDHNTPHFNPATAGQDRSYTKNLKPLILPALIIIILMSLGFFITRLRTRPSLSPSAPSATPVAKVSPTNTPTPTTTVSSAIDLKTINQAANYDQITNISTTLYLLDTTTPRLDIYDTKAQKLLQTIKDPLLSEVISLVPNNQDLYLSTSTHIYQLSSGKLKSVLILDNINPTSFAFWNSALYLLDTEAGKLYKSTPIISGFSTPTSWLTTGQKLPIDLIHLAIDLDVWLSDGTTFYRFSKGQKVQQFTPTTPVVGFTIQKGQILALSDTALIYYDKSGSNLKQTILVRPLSLSSNFVLLENQTVESL